MKKNITKRLLAALLATALAFSLTACGGGNDAAGGGETNESGETASAALTEEEYQQAVEKFSADMSELQTSANEAVSDPESAIAILDEMKVSINEFASVTPPEVYADAHAKLKSGCESLIAFIDTVAAMTEATDQAELDELTTQMSEQMEAAMADMTEGVNMLKETSE